MLRRIMLRRCKTSYRAAAAGMLLSSTLVVFTISALYSHDAVLLSAPRGPPARAADQYTLPSLEEVLRASTDLDLNRVLRQYKRDQKQVPSDTPKVRIILTSSWRSGSTLLGEVVSAHPGSYYHYEPFMPYGVRQVEAGHQVEVNNLLSDLFRCDYRHLDDYLRFAFVNADVFSRNKRLWAMCSALPRTKCYAPDILGKLCGLFPIHVAKLVRVRLSFLETQLIDPRVVIVWLVRDPRAMMNSRLSNVDWCLANSCKDPSLVCSALYEDYLSYLALKEKYPSKIMLLRYEDFARDAYNKSKKVLEFAGLSFHEDVVAYLDEHLNNNVEAPWSTKHEPKSIMGRWLKTMKWDEVIKVQQQCVPYMKALGYRIFGDPVEMTSGNSLGLLNLPV
ncbi:Sulfotransferase domain [Trinorchestia longiramus]|nr:Sulfotransferase domain [Trinorchestia longiramus]